MPKKIMIELSEQENKIVEYYKIFKDLKTKQEAIKEMVLCFSVNMKIKKK